MLQALHRLVEIKWIRSRCVDLSGQRRSERLHHTRSLLGFQDGNHRPYSFPCQRTRQGWDHSKCRHYRAE